MKELKVGDKVWFVDTMHNDPLNYKVEIGICDRILPDGLIKIGKVRKEVEAWYVPREVVFETKEEAERSLSNILIEKATEAEERWKKLLRKAKDNLR